MKQNNPTLFEDMWRLPLGWCVWGLFLALINGAGVLFITRFEGATTIVAGALSTAWMISLHRRWGFSRLLGLAHAVWIPLLFVLATGISGNLGNGVFHLWMVFVFWANAVSLVIDGFNVARALSDNKGRLKGHFSPLP